MIQTEQTEQRQRARASPAPSQGSALSTVLAKYVGGILSAGMAVYACVQYFLMPDQTVPRLVIEHLSHIVFLVLLVYVTLYVVLLKVIVTPIHAFRAKLYRVAGGDLTPITERSRINEMQEMGDAINLMIERLAAGLPHVSLVDISTSATELRELAQQSDNLTMEQKQTLLNTAEEIEDLVALITRNVVRNTDNNRKGNKDEGDY